MLQQRPYCFMCGEKRLSHVYLLVSTKRDKVRVGSTFGDHLGKRLTDYRVEVLRKSDDVHKWVKGVGVDFLRINRMLSLFCSERAIKVLKQDFIGRYGCGLNT